MRSDNHQSYRADASKTDGTRGAPAWVALLPVSVVALGTPTQPVESLMTLQSGLNRLMRILTGVAWPRWKPSMRQLLTLRPQHLARSGTPELARPQTTVGLHS